MKLSFMTLGCPDWDLDTVCQKGREYGFDGIDFRGLKDEPRDVTLSKEFTTDLNQSIQKLKDHGLEVSGLSSDISLCDEGGTQNNLEIARRMISLSKSLNSRLVRVFGKGNPETHKREEMVRMGAEMMNQILALDGADQVDWVLETHDHWIRSADTRALIDAVNSPHFGALWDMCHTNRVGNELPAQTLECLGDRVKYLHIKDAVKDPTLPKTMPGGWCYVAPGEGIVPIGEALRLMLKRGYDGWLNFEHEKRWQRHLPEPEVVFPKFVAWARKILESTPVPAGR